VRAPNHRVCGAQVDGLAQRGNAITDGGGAVNVVDLNRFGDGTLVQSASQHHHHLHLAVERCACFEHLAIELHGLLVLVHLQERMRKIQHHIGYVASLFLDALKRRLCLVQDVVLGQGLVKQKHLVSTQGYASHWLSAWAHRSKAIGGVDAAGMSAQNLQVLAVNGSVVPHTRT